MKSRERRQPAIRFATPFQAAACVVALCAAGCLPKWGWPPPAAEPCALRNPTPEQLVAYINAQSDRLRSLQCYDVAVKLKTGRMPTIPLHANLAAQRPNSLRLKVSSTMTGPEADFGSNPRRFWFWIRRGEFKHVFYAHHEDVETVQRRGPLPMRPDWVMDALLIPRLEPQRLRIIPNEGPDSALALFEMTEADAGGMMRRLIWVDRCHGSVVKQVLKDARGTTIATAEFSQFQPDKLSGLRMPHQIVLDWPAQQTSMTLSLGRVIVNPTEFAPATWTFPDYSGYTPFDMARDSTGQAPRRPVSRVSSPVGIHRVSNHAAPRVRPRRFERPILPEEPNSRAATPREAVGRIKISPRTTPPSRPNFVDE